MKDFHKGVSYYTKATVEIGFPEDDVCCHWCPFLAHDYKLDREKCNKTGEILVAPKHDIGFMCPLNFKYDGTEALVVKPDNGFVFEVDDI